tara:strand:- start:10311 stop:11495 length:1185 start_codon:yes stop_codon:yes gene_type:complete
MSKKKKPIPVENSNNFFKAGWKPNVDFDHTTGTGEITHVGTDPNYESKTDEILKEWGFDPELYEIDGILKVSSWNTQLKGGIVETFFAFKGSVRRKSANRDKYFQSLFKQAVKKPPLKDNGLFKGDTAFFFFLSDWQLGKDDYGVENTIKRFDVALQDGVKLLKNHRKTGFKIDEIYLVGMGDLTENCTKFFYDSQPYNVSLNLLEQYSLARALIFKAVETFLPHADKIILSGVPGNHGEMTRSSKGQVLTSRLDNSDTMHLEIMDEIFKANPDRYNKVEVIIPDGYHLTLDVKGQTMAFTHGHMTNGSGNAENKIEQWWKGQMYGWLPVGEASILITAHYHHFRAKNQGDRHWFQCPSLDKSIDFTQRTGLWSHPGVLTLLVNDRGPSFPVIV